MQFSFRERFIGLPNAHTKGLYAPLTIGAPQQTHSVDYKVFKQSKEEKEVKKLVKAEHKKDLIRAFGVGKTRRKMNVTST